MSQKNPKPCYMMAVAACLRSNKGGDPACLQPQTAQGEPLRQGYNLFFSSAGATWIFKAPCEVF